MKKGLGKGLAALIGDLDEDIEEGFIVGGVAGV